MTVDTVDDARTEAGLGSGFGRCGFLCVFDEMDKEYSHIVPTFKSNLGASLGPLGVWSSFLTYCLRQVGTVTTCTCCRQVVCNWQEGWVHLGSVVGAPASMCSIEKHQSCSYVS